MMLVLQKNILFYIKKKIPTNVIQPLFSKNYHISIIHENEEKFEYNDSFQRSYGFNRNYNSNPQHQRYGFKQRRSIFRGDQDGFQFKELPKAEKTPLLVEKFLYVEHPDIVNRSEEEVENYRKLMNISIKGVNVPKPVTKFSELCLPENLMKILNRESYKEPTPIQAQGWPIALSGKDLIGISQTGSGKTLAYMLPAIVHAVNHERAKSSECMPRILVLGPTRELVQQIHQVSRKFIEASSLMGACVYGGASKHVQLTCLEGADICIATPGRLIDFISSNQVSMNNCSYLVLDEADRMLDMGFEPQIRDIIDQLRPGRQTLMWSATWPIEIRNLAEEFLSDYVKVTVGSGELVANANIKQNIYVISEEKKENQLISLLKNLFASRDNKVLIFTQTKRKVDYLIHILGNIGFNTLGIHGDVSQSGRDRSLSSFRRSKSAVLIATDIAARGLDITDIQHVVNYDFPPNMEDYVHRIGRTARGDACGESHSFFTTENLGLLKKLIAVLKQCNQEINPQLESLSGNHWNSNGNVPWNRYRSPSFNRRMNRNMY